MIGIFKQKAPGNVALLLILGLVLKLPLFLSPKLAASTPLDGKLYAAFILWLTKNNAAFSSGIIAFLLIYIHALVITGIINEYRMTARSNFLPGMAYMMITSLLPEWSFLSAPLVAATFIIWAFAMLFQLYNNEYANTKIYNIGLLLGVSSLFYFPALLFAICVITGLLILRSFRLNEIFLLILGAITPYYFYGVYLFLTDQLSLQKLIPQIDFQLPPLTTSLWVVGAILLLTIPFLTGGYYIQTQLRKMLIQARKNWSIVLLYLFFALFIAFVNNGGTYTNWVIAIAPFSAFHASAYFYPPRTWLTTILFFGTIGFILAQQYVTNAWQ